MEVRFAHLVFYLPRHHHALDGAGAADGRLRGPAENTHPHAGPGAGDGFFLYSLY